MIYGINVPTEATLKKYGLDYEDWEALVLQQVGTDKKWHCPLCLNTPPSGRTVIDHKHVRLFKKMRPEERSKYVRGITCTNCNRFILSRFATIDRLRRAADYLEAFDAHSS